MISARTDDGQCGLPVALGVKEVTVKSEAVTEANKLSASLQKKHITKNWRQWNLGVIVWQKVK